MEEPYYNCANKTNDFVAFITSLFSSESLIIIYDESYSIDLTSIQNSCDYDAVTKIQIYSVDSGDDQMQDTLNIFESVNMYSELRFFIIVSHETFANIMNAANNVDDYLGQQGYFTNLHKWIYLDRSHSPCSNDLLPYIRRVDNVVCVDTNYIPCEFKLSINLYTAMYSGNELRYWDKAPCTYPYITGWFCS